MGQQAQLAARRLGQQREAEVGQGAVITSGLGADRVGLDPQDPGDDVAVVGQVAEALDPGEHSVEGPADVDRRRPARPELGRGTADPGAALGVRAIPRVLGGQGEAVGRRLAEGRGAPDDHLADRDRDLRAVRAGVLDELSRQLALVDEQDPVVVHPERGPEAARFARSGIDQGGGRIEKARRREHRVDPGRAAWFAAERVLRVEDRPGRIRRGPLEGAGGARRRSLPSGSPRPRTGERRTAGRGRPRARRARRTAGSSDGASARGGGARTAREGSLARWIVGCRVAHRNPAQ